MTIKYDDFEDFVLTDYYRNCGVPKDIAIDRESDYLGDLTIEDWFELGDRYAKALTANSSAENEETKIE